MKGIDWILFRKKLGLGLVFGALYLLLDLLFSFTVYNALFLVIRQETVCDYLCHALALWILSNIVYKSRLMRRDVFFDHTSRPTNLPFSVREETKRLLHFPDFREEQRACQTLIIPYEIVKTFLTYRAAQEDGQEVLAKYSPGHLILLAVIGYLLLTAGCLFFDWWAWIKTRRQWHR